MQIFPKEDGFELRKRKICIGIAPIIRFHSVIESPECVSRVIPPINTIPATIVAPATSQATIHFLSRMSAKVGFYLALVVNDLHHTTVVQKC